MIIRCKFCYGNGKIGDMINGYEPCPVCDGAGEFSIDIPKDCILKCRFCNESGKIGDMVVGYKPCPVCKGIGINEWSTPQDRTVECKLCNGSGKIGDMVVGYKPCHVCKGIGIIERPYKNSSTSSTKTKMHPATPRKPKNLGEMNGRIETGSSILQGNIKTVDFDVFLCHNSEDKLEVKEIGEKLKEAGLLPWLDEWELRPGLPWQEILEKEIEHIKSAAVIVGKNGIGPWQQQELNAFLREFVNRGCPVIPVLLPDAPKEPKLPVFLKGMTWIDFRKNERDSIKRLIWGITGKRIN